MTADGNLLSILRPPNESMCYGLAANVCSLIVYQRDLYISCIICLIFVYDLARPVRGLSRESLPSPTRALFKVVFVTSLELICDRIRFMIRLLFVTTLLFSDH
jgi:hypothetical protein